MLPLLSSAYLAPVQWYSKLFRSDGCWMEQHDHFIKQTYRNRCIIATANGAQALTIPIERPSGEQASRMAMKDIRISDHGNWRHIHWQAIVSAYNESPFFEYYADDFRPFFERRFEVLFDFNLELTHTICTLLDFTPNILLTPAFVPTQTQLASGTSLPAAFVDADTGSNPTFEDFRDTIVPKNPPHDPDFTPRPYYQVFAQRHGFLPNLSIIDLLFNMGNEAPLYL